jgi:preprotein translocase SecE subunit
MDMTWIESKNARMTVATIVPSAVFVILGFLIYLLINKPAVSDFLIASEGEIKKVNWSSRKEIAVSTFIVIVVVAIVSVVYHPYHLATGRLHPASTMLGTGAA